MKYSMYTKKNEPKYKRNNKYNPLLWEMDEQGYKYVQMDMYLTNM